MSEQTDYPQAAQVLDGESLSASFYSGQETSQRPDASAPRSESKGEKPTHYKVICISMYTEDLARLDGMVEELKKRGLTKANRSALIRHALSLVDLDQVPRGL